MSSKITLVELAEGLANRKGVSKKDAESFVRNVFDIVEEYLTKEKIVKIKGFGTFKLVGVESRESVNVNTGERFVIDGHSRVTFTPDAVLRDQVNKPFADFETIALNDGVDIAEMERTDYPLEPLTPLQPSLWEGEEEEKSVSDSEPIPEETVLVDSIPVIEEPAEEPAVEEKSFAEEESAAEEPEEEHVEQEPEKESGAEAAPVHIEHQTVEEMTVTRQHVEHQTIQHITPAPLPDSVERRNRLSWSTLLMQLLMVLLLMLGAFWLGLNWNKLALNFMPQEEMQPDSFVAAKTDSVEIERADTLAAASADEMSSEEKTTAQPETAKQPAPTPQPIATPKQATVSKPTAKPAQHSAAKPTSTPKSFLEMRGEEGYPQLPGGTYRIVGVKAVHTMAPGDYLYKISRKYYGDNSAAAYIIVLNGLADRENIPIGTRLKLPVLEKK